LPNRLPPIVSKIIKARSGQSAAEEVSRSIGRTPVRKEEEEEEEEGR